MPIDPFRPFEDFIVVVGIKGSGKTVYTIWLMKYATRKIMLDPQWQAQTGYIVHYVERIKPAFKEYGYVTFQPTTIGMNKTERNEMWDYAFQVLLTFQNYCLVVDEVEKFAKPNWYLSENFREIVNRGRHQGIGLICNSRRPSSFHSDIKGNADYVVCFQLHANNDIEYVAEWMNVPKQQIKTLPRYHSLLYDVKKAEVTVQTPLHLPV